MSAGWKFPANNFGIINGIGEAGIETFKGTPCKSLAREICQNSLDARICQDKPVIIEFSLRQIDSELIPDFSTLKEAVKSCLNFWEKQKNKKTVDFFKKAAEISEQKQMSLLRISDFNTTGLTGSDKEYNTPWQNLVKASGVSDKSGSSGGSFGIGKSAPFACSDLRTVFYSTYDENGLKATQGIARLVSFVLNSEDSGDGEEIISTGIGYYGETERNQAIRECWSLDETFHRTEAGTDVFIPGFTERPEWEIEIIISILEDFLVSVYLGFLEVRVENMVISRTTLPEIMEEYKESAVKAYNYYQTLISPEAHVMTENYEGLGDVELHILIQNGLHRRVLMSRMNGMKVFDQKNFPSAIQFAGICILKDVAINSYFREMENPRHDAWEPERHKRPAEAKRLKQVLFRYIKENILAFGRKTTVAEVDAEGMGEYLPDDAINDEEKNKYESIADVTKNVEIEISDLKKCQKGSERTLHGNDTDMENAQGIPDEEGFGDRGSRDFGDDESRQSENGSGFGRNEGNNSGISRTGNNRYDTGIDGKPSQQIRKKFEIRTMEVRLILLDGKNNRYCLFFIPEETSGEGYLQFKLSGEQNNMIVNVSNASNLITGDLLKTSGNLIYLEHIVAKNKMSVEFNVDYGENSSMEVNLYGYKI